VDGALGNATQTTPEVPATTTAETKTFIEKYKKAFSKENIEISF
jgi:hypothetical protein